MERFETVCGAALLCSDWVSRIGSFGYLLHGEADLAV